MKRRFGGSTRSVAKAPPVSKKPEKKVVRRRNRPQRAFTHRGVFFIVKNEGNVSRIFIEDPNTGNIEHQIDVPKEQMLKARNELVKIARAEMELARISGQSKPARRSTDAPQNGSYHHELDVND